MNEFSVTFTYATKQVITPQVSATPTIANKVLQLIIGNNEITVAELARVIGVAEITIKRNIKALQKEDKISRIGSDKTGSWKVIIA